MDRAPAVPRDRTPPGHDRAGASEIITSDTDDLRVLAAHAEVMPSIQSI